MESTLTDRLLTLHEVCDATRMSLAKLFRLRRSGLGPREIRLGRAVLVSEPALRDWIEGMEHKPGPRRRKGTNRPQNASASLYKAAGEASREGLSKEAFGAVMLSGRTQEQESESL
jgi:predicted DNA-binding transcriptional regulator AlpA